MFAWRAFGTCPRVAAIRPDAPAAWAAHCSKQPGACIPKKRNRGLVSRAPGSLATLDLRPVSSRSRRRRHLHLHRSSVSIAQKIGRSRKVVGAYPHPGSTMASRKPRKRRQSGRRRHHCIHAILDDPLVSCIFADATVAAGDHPRRQHRQIVGCSLSRPRPSAPTPTLICAILCSATTSSSVSCTLTVSHAVTMSTC